ncbi:MAG: potassium transporter TrkG, partial [Oscillospiraceae bacterium]
GSTGGGIKTTTFFILARACYAASTNKPCKSFKRKLPTEIIRKASVIVLLALTLVLTSTFLLCVAEPETSFINILFEAISAFGTVGLSTGITPDLCVFSKTVIILTMYIGRLGPLTVASLWVFKPDSDLTYAEESVTIG